MTYWMHMVVDDEEPAGYRDFLARLFANKPDDTKILIHQLPLQKSRFYDTAKEAADAVEKIVDGPQNIYTTGGLLKPGIKRGRGTGCRSSYCAGA